MRNHSTKAVIQSYQPQTSHQSQFRQLHGGELKVETIEEEGTTFVIQLPID